MSGVWRLAQGAGDYVSHAWLWEFQTGTTALDISACFNENDIFPEKRETLITCLVAPLKKLFINLSVLDIDLDCS